MKATVAIIVFVVLLPVAAFLAGCGDGTPRTPEESNLDDGVWTFCDQKHLVYRSSLGGLSVVPNDPRCAE